MDRCIVIYRCITYGGIKVTGNFLINGKMHSKNKSLHGYW